jgi:glycosyltransferase involved in cell wall biosynthesis
MDVFITKSPSFATMPALRITLTVTNDLTYDQRMQRICRSLSGAGYEVKLVGRVRADSKPLDKKSYQQVRLHCLFDKGKLFYLEYNLRLFFYLLFHQANIICAIDLDTIVGCYYAAKSKGAKIVYDAHEYFPEVPEVVRRPRIQRVWQWVERSYVPRMDAIYTVTQSIADIFAKNYNKKVNTIRNLPYRQGTTSLKKTDTKYILYQGALNEGRGLEHLIEAMTDLDIELWLAGDGDITKQLKEQVKSLSLEHKVRFTGYVKPDELKDITAHAYIGINLLEMKGLSYYYSLANKFLDYIQAGVPQVCIDFPEYRKINDEYNVALLVENLEKETIKSAIGHLIADKDLYLILKENCLVCSRELTWENEEKKLIALYEQLH